MKSTASPYVVHLVTELRGPMADPEVRRRLSELSGVVELLVKLDLEPLRPLLAQGYADTPWGRPPRDPVCMLRCLLLMALCHGPSVRSWVERMEREPELVILSGFRLEKGRPGVGTLYDFIGRLLAGPFNNWSPPQSRPRDRYRGARQGAVRHLKREKEDRPVAGQAGKQRLQHEVKARRGSR